MAKHKNASGLGFRNFRDFNLAMLGKQGWRFITNPESLVSRLYKAKYFAGGDFLSANMGHNPSFIWRSIFATKQLLLDGVKWRIGSGENIYILGQPWLLDDANPFITTISPTIENQKVSSLFCFDKKEWDVEVIKDIFNDRDQRQILAIQLREESHEDVLYWSLENSGMYSIKSAYKLLQVQKGAWSAHENPGIWKLLWSVRAPPKALNLVWRALSQCLPTLSQLQIKRVPVQTLCPVCHGEDETILHGPVTCPFAKQCWSLLNIEVTWDPNMDFMRWMELILGSGTAKQRAEFITLCLAIWRSRNDVVWNQKFSSVNKVVAAAKQYLTQWIIAQNRSTSTLLQPQFNEDGVTTWVKPQPNTVKVSVDAAIFEDRNEAGFGMIARDSDGQLIEAKVLTQSEVPAPVLKEAIAVKEALSWIDQKRWLSVTLQSDCLVVVQAIRSGAFMRSRFGEVISECRNLVRRLNNIQLLFVKRSVNMVAHQLARESYRYPGRTFDRWSIPTYIQTCIETDLLSL